MIEIENLTVKYGGVTSLDALTLVFDRGTCGLIGPNGAGKTTFFNVLSGFVRPASGTVKAFGTNLLGMAHYRRARWGVRRTFQTEQAIEELTVYDNVAMVASPLRGAARRADVLAAIEYVGIDASPGTRVGTLGAGQRRLVEVARAVVGKPRLVLLDEPAAGLPDQETAHLSAGDPRHTRVRRRADDPGRPRHVAGLRGVRDDGGARLRQADRVWPDRGGAEGRARDARLPRDGGGLMSTLTLGGLTVERGGRPVVKDVTITVPAGRGDRRSSARTAPASPPWSSPSAACCARGQVSVSLDGTELAGRRPRRSAPRAWRSSRKGAGCCPT